MCAEVLDTPKLMLRQPRELLLVSRRSRVEELAKDSKVKVRQQVSQGLLR